MNDDSPTRHHWVQQSFDRLEALDVTSSPSPRSLNFGGSDVFARKEDALVEALDTSPRVPRKRGVCDGRHLTLEREGSSPEPAEVGGVLLMDKLGGVDHDALLSGRLEPEGLQVEGAGEGQVEFAVRQRGKRFASYPMVLHEACPGSGSWDIMRAESPSPPYLGDTRRKRARRECAEAEAEEPGTCPPSSTSIQLAASRLMVAVLEQPTVAAAVDNVVRVVSSVRAFVVWCALLVFAAVCSPFFIAYTVCYAAVLLAKRAARRPKTTIVVLLAVPPLIFASVILTLSAAVFFLPVCVIAAALAYRYCPVFQRKRKRTHKKTT